MSVLSRLAFGQFDPVYRRQRVIHTPLRILGSLQLPVYLSLCGLVL